LGRGYAATVKRGGEAATQVAPEAVPGDEAAKPPNRRSDERLPRREAARQERGAHIFPTFLPGDLRPPVQKVDSKVFSPVQSPYLVWMAAALRT
jgi:hypothetical protein